MRDWCGRTDSTVTRPTTRKPPTTSPDRAKETSETVASTSAPCSCKGRAPLVRTCREPWTTRSRAAIWDTPGAVQTRAGYTRQEMVYRPTKRRLTNTGRKPESFPRAQHEGAITHTCKRQCTCKFHIIITIHSRW